MPTKWIAGSVGVFAVALVAFAGWWFFIKGDEPPPVSLADAIAGLEGTASPTANMAVVTPGAATSTATAAGSETAAGSNVLDGTWTVDASQSILGYRIDEVLAGLGATTAVGRTSTIEGTLEFDGASITSVSITADLRDLESDDSRRDGQLRRQAIQTDQFPEATFVLAEPIAIEGDPASGQEISATAVGDLTLHGVTNRVEIPLQGQLVNGQVVVVGSTLVVLADYDISAPSAMSVVSVADEATIELQLVFRKA